MLQDTLELPASLHAELDKPDLQFHAWKNFTSGGAARVVIGTLNGGLVDFVPC